MEIVKPEPSAAQIRARGGWIIQIGAFEAEEEAKQHLSEARLKIPHILASADPFTERVQKGRQGALSGSLCRVRQSQCRSRLQTA